MFACEKNSTCSGFRFDEGTNKCFTGSINCDSVVFAKRGKGVKVTQDREISTDHKSRFHCTVAENSFYPFI